MMKDKDYLNNILEIEKSISNQYSTFLNEASNDYLYENIFSMLEDSKDMAREIYNLLFVKEPYDLVEVEINKLNLTLAKLEKMLES